MKNNQKIRVRLLVILVFISLIRLGNCANYYVNDGVYNNDDIYTTAVGNNTNNGTNGKFSSSPMRTFRGLWAAFGPFVNGDVIYVDAGTYVSSIGGTLTQNYGYTITKNITIIGAGNTKTIFNNNYCGTAGNYYFASISGAGSVTIKDIQFTKYASNVDGQVFQIANSVVNFTNVLTNSNGGSSKYGSITVNSNSTLTMNGGGMNCNGDVAHGASGGIDVKGTNILVNVTNTSFVGNYKSSTATIGNGAGLTITAADATRNVNYYNCLFADCFTDNNSSSGGTIYQTTGNLTMTDCIINNSKTLQGSIKYGGAAYFTGGTTLFTRVRITNCINNGGSTYGTVSVFGGNVTLESCYFSNNLSDRGNDIYCKSGTITTNNCSFSSTASQSATYGGTVKLKKSNSPSNILSTGTYTCDNLASTALATPITPSFTGTCLGGIVLPIELLYFEGKKTGKNNLLSWATATELNNDYFTVEKTLDGINYESVGIQNGAGNSQELNEYNILDCFVDKTINYYRLKQTDYDGKFTFHDLISINNKSIETKEIKLKTNLLGQKIDDNFKGLTIIYYTDGTYNKTFQ